MDKEVWCKKKHMGTISLWSEHADGDAASVSCDEHGLHHAHHLCAHKRQSTPSDALLLAHSWQLETLSEGYANILALHPSTTNEATIEIRHI